MRNVCEVALRKGANISPERVAQRKRTHSSHRYQRPNLIALLRFLIVAACLSASGAAFSQQQIAIGSKKFTESYVLSEIAKILLERARFDVTHRQGMGGTVILWQALLHGDIALYPEYTGTISEEILKTTTPLTLDEMRAALKNQGIGMTSDLGFNDGYALAMRRDRSQKLGIKTVSDLRNHPDLNAGMTPEFLGRKDGWQPLLARYGLRFSNIRGIEHGLGYAALSNGQIDFKDCYTTDAKIAELDLVTLDDDLSFFPQYRAVFLYRLDAPPTAIEAIRALEGQIDEAKMIDLNRRAEQAKNYAFAARSFFETGTAKASANGAKDQIYTLLAELPRLTRQHLTLVIISLLMAILLSVPLGIVASRGGLLSQLILGLAGVIQTIPSLALLALMIPVFGIGQLPSIVALFLYSLLPIIRNTAIGLESIPSSLREAGEALGLSGWTRLRLIYLPIASPAILAGIKTSAIITVGTATLAGLIGGGGFGEPIQSGLQLNDNATILQGAIPAALLALVVQFAFDRLERLITPRGLRIATARAGRA